MRYRAIFTLFIVLSLLIFGCSGNSDKRVNFIDNGNGTVLEIKRGLLWQQTSDNQTRGHAEAITYCSNLILGGLRDWRLPSKKELLGLVIYEIAEPNPTIDREFFPNAVATNYWTSTAYSGNQQVFWFVNFAQGFTYYYDPSERFLVRCVKGERRSYSPIYIDNKDGTVTDNATGLTWQQGETDKMTWQEAIDYCKGLNLGGKNDWRLPDPKSLQSLAEERLFNPAIDRTYFPNAYSTHYWTSNEYVNDTNKAWDVGFGNGDMYFHDKEEKAYVRCVRF